MKNALFNLPVNRLTQKVASQLALTLASKLVTRPDFSLDRMPLTRQLMINRRLDLPVADDNTNIRLDVLLHIRADLRVELLTAFRSLVVAGRVAITQGNSLARIMREMPQLRLDVLLHLDADAYPSRLLRTVPAFRKLQEGASGPKRRAARNGMWVECNKHAVVIARGVYLDDNKHGLWREYYDTGELMLEQHYIQGVVHGRFATFHPNGICCSEGHYEQGLRHGAFCMYDESGRLMRTLQFEGDKLVHDLNVDNLLATA